VGHRNNNSDGPIEAAMDNLKTATSKLGCLSLVSSGQEAIDSPYFKSPWEHRQGTTIV